MKEKLNILTKLVRYNLKIVFANKFIYFLIAALAFYFLIIGIMLFSESTTTTKDIFEALIVPGVLVLFYPTIYGIQNDKDARMLEIIFAIPNYRYKVYLLRFLISFVLLFFVLLGLTYLTGFALIKFNELQLLFQLMYLMLFISCLSFLFSTLMKSGNSAAVTLIIISLFFIILADSLEHSKWNIFLNPYNVPTEMSTTVWENVIYQNHLMIIIASVIFLFWSLINLQKRETFV
jgi:hypothetical protein